MKITLKTRSFCFFSLFPLSPLEKHYLEGLCNSKLLFLLKTCMRFCLQYILYLTSRFCFATFILDLKNNVFVFSTSLVLYMINCRINIWPRQEEFKSKFNRFEGFILLFTNSSTVQDRFLLGYTFAASMRCAAFKYCYTNSGVCTNTTALTKLQCLPATHNNSNVHLPAQATVKNVKTL